MNLGTNPDPTPDSGADQKVVLPSATPVPDPQFSCIPPVSPRSRKEDTQHESWTTALYVARSPGGSHDCVRQQQQLAHHTITGCNLRTGDMMASGTVSGPEPSSRGCLLELTWRGEQPLKLSDGTERTFLADHDRVTISGWCQGNGHRVGFGEVTGQLLPAVA